MKSLAEILEEDSVVHTRISKREGYKIHHEWLELFAKKLKDQSGKYKIGNYIWEAYWSGVLPSISGDEAFDHYRSSPIEDYYVIFENGEEVFSCRSGKWPNFFSNEVIVFPISKSWSMVFSHEETIHFVKP
jgi:hypothetical protein